MEMRGFSEPLALTKTVRQLGIDDPDSTRLARSLVFETVRRKNFLDAFINEVIQPAKIDQFELGVQAFLRLYVYCTKFSGWSESPFKEAESAARLARSILGWKTMLPVEPFLGALLTHESYSIFANKDDATRVAFRTFHPKWFVDYCFRLFGRRDALSFLESDTSPLPLYMRLNTLKASDDEILKRLMDEGVEIEKVEQLEFEYRVVKTEHPLARGDSFKEGLIYLQDKSSGLAAEAANPVPGMTVLDVCCAPGAVTTYVAQLMRNEGRIISLDYSRRRMESWKNEVRRFGTKIVEPIIADACSPFPFRSKANVLILNPPCTDTGSFARLPSSKWRLTSHSIARMAELQWKMLDNCSEYVEPGGVIVYFTSSVTVEENEMVIEKFLKWHPEYLSCEMAPKLGLPGFRGFDKCQRLYPHIHACNGSFIAKLRKTS